MRKYFFTFLVTTAIIIFTLAFLENSEFISYDSNESVLIKRSQTTINNNCAYAESKVKVSVPEKTETKYNYLKKYPSILDCNIATQSVQPFQVDILKNDPLDFSLPAQNETHEKRVVRGVVVYFPIEKYRDFILEFKWMYRSWIEMQKYEPSKWRTDLIVFINTDNDIVKMNDFLLAKLNCSENYRYIKKTLSK